MSPLEITVQTLAKRVETLEEELLQMSALFESLHFAVMQVKSEKEDIIRIVTESVSQGLGIGMEDLMHLKKYHVRHKGDYHETWLPMGRGNAAKAIFEDPVTRARLVVLFFLRFFFPQTLGTLKLNFSWVTARQDQNVRYYWAGVLTPQTPLDRLLRNETIKCQGIISQKINLTVFI